MNSKTIVRRTLPLIIALVLVIGIAISCTLWSNDKKVPQISKPNDSFLTIDGVKVTNQEMYKNLKFDYGVTTLMDLIDTELLKKTKNAEGVSYLDAVTDEAIDDEIEKAMFPNGRGNDPEEVQKAIDAWYRTQYLSYGLKEDKIEEAYRLTLAKRAYTRDQLAKDEKLIKDSDISTYYEANYQKAYWAIVVRYNTLQEAKDALSQIGISIQPVKLEEGSDKETDFWVWADTKEPLTQNEINQAHITLYNNANAYKAPDYPNAGNPSKNLVLGEAQYTITDGKIVFNTTYNTEDEKAPANLLYYKTSALKSMHSTLESNINSMDVFTSENAKIEKTYIRNPLTAGNYVYFALKIGFELPTELYDDKGEIDNEELRAEIYEKVLDSKITNTAIAEQMKKLRQGKNNALVIYDAQLEAQYISGYDATFKETKKENDVLVAEILGTDIKFTATELYDAMAKKFGQQTAYTLYLRNWLLGTKEYNNIYDVKNDKVLNKAKWDEINEQLASIKTAFANGSYVDPSYGWTNFLRDYYNLDSEKALKIDLVYSRALENYNKKLAELTEEIYNELYVPKMQEIYDDYFSASGIHLLIYKTNELGNPISPMDETHDNKWTEYEIEVAKELYDMILTELQTQRPNNYQTFLETTLIQKYNNAPRFLANKEQVISEQPVYSELTDWVELEASDYKYSKFKSAGLVIKFETLSSITPGQMVEPFEDAVRAIWEKDAEADAFGDKKVIYDKTFDDYLITEFGFHVYINTKTTNRPSTTVDKNPVIQTPPTYAQVMIYERTPLAGDENKELTALEKNRISTFYTPIRNEVTGSAYQQIKIVDTLLKLADEGKVQFADSEYLAAYIKHLTYTRELSVEGLNYFAEK